MFWKCMKPKGGGKMPEKLKKRIELDFGSIIEFKKVYTSRYYPVWIRLVLLSINNGKLVISKHQMLRIH